MPRDQNTKSEGDLAGLGAKAFARGDDVVFETRLSDDIVAHEAVHVVQAAAADSSGGDGNARAPVTTGVMAPAASAAQAAAQTTAVQAQASMIDDEKYQTEIARHDQEQVEVREADRAADEQEEAEQDQTQQAAELVEAQPEPAQAPEIEITETQATGAE